MKLPTFLAFLSLLACLSPGAASPIADKRNQQDRLPLKPIFSYISDTLKSEHIDYSTTEHKNSAIPDWPTSHLLARRLLALSKTGVLSTVYPKSSSDSALAGVPVGLPDYYAACEDDTQLLEFLGRGNPLILALNLGTTFRNTKAGSNISLSIDWWENVPPSKGEDLDKVAAAFPRLSLLGWLAPLPTTLPAPITKSAVEKCFLAAHPDAKYWLPDDPNAAHSGYWARLVVEKAYWVGGFGDRARIGWLNVENWRNIKKNGKDGEKGWADVRLPEEKMP